MTADYTITPGINDAGDTDRPLGSHQVNAHKGPDDITCSPTQWSSVQCFWCHNTDEGQSTCGPIYQGTYGTSLHLDGQTHFKPQTTDNADPGTMAPGVTHAASDGHCGDKKSCW
jgi:hypothetical protein